MHIRPAVRADLPALLQLEDAGFSSDRISDRSFRRFLKQPQDILLVAEAAEGGLLGYGLLLRRRGTRLARLYSLVVSSKARGQGVGRQLLQALEDEAQAEGSRFIRLEVRTDNAGAIALYRSCGYRTLGEREGYYEDGSNALQMEKRLHSSHRRPEHLPYYSQSTPFTCGPAALMMAMHQQDKSRPLDRAEEIRIWREATTVYMTTGLGGTSPFGLALAAAHRGFEAQVWASHLVTPFLDSVRSDHKRKLMVEVHQTFLADCQQSGVVLAQRDLLLTDIPALLAEGWALLILISTWRLNRNKAPHWVWLVDVDEHHAFLNDPDIDEDFQQSEIDNQFMPVSFNELDAMTRYGKNRYRAAVLVRRPGNKVV